MNLKDVFDVHPDVDTIFVVDDQPFLDERVAGNHARTVKKEIVSYTREEVYADVVVPEEDKTPEEDETPEEVLTPVVKSKGRRKK